MGTGNDDGSTTFVVTHVFDLETQDGLLVSGAVRQGKLQQGMRLQDDTTGAMAQVLALEFLSPRDIATGEVTILLERTSPSPARPGVTLTAIATG